MKFLFNVLTVGLLMHLSSCIKQELETPLLTPDLTDFTIDNKQLGEAPFALINPKSKGEGEFIFKINDSRLAIIDGNVVTIKNSGTCTITAVQVASGDFKRDSISATFIISPLQIPLMSDFNAPEKKLGDAPFELVAPKSNSKGAITYTSSNPEVASIAENIVTIKALGTTQITAIQAADGIYAAGKISTSFVVMNQPVPEHTVTDINGNVYKTIKIGTQIWMAENLKATQYKDGSVILHLTGAAEWASNSNGAYCNYSNDPAYGSTYGKLYNWHAVNSAKLAPEGWHIPSEAEWQVLFTYIGGKREDGKRLQETGTVHWIAAGTADNSSLFTALPGGRRSETGVFSSIRYDGFWWTRTSTTGVPAVAYNLYVKGYLERRESGKACGFSVRCVKD